LTMPEPDPQPPTLAQRLNRLRERSGLGMNETARRAGMRPEQAWRIFDGRNTNPTIQTIERLVMAMGFTLRDLFADEPLENPKNPGEGA
jgi:transcriptional regulator with XRE-family HTH domain